jgi:hypothetical protein
MELRVVMEISHIVQDSYTIVADAPHQGIDMISLSRLVSTVGSGTALSKNDRSRPGSGINDRCYFHVVIIVNAACIAYC